MADEKKKGRGEIRFHPIFPHSLQNSPKAPQGPTTPPFLQQLQAFSAPLYHFSCIPFIPLK